MSYWDRAGTVQRKRAVDVADLAREASTLLDRDGFAALTLRAVATRVGVAPASVYSRVDHRDDLLDLALDHTLAHDRELQRCLARSDPHALLLIHYRHLLRHPWAIRVLALRPPRGPAYLHLSERLCTLLSDAGAADPLALAYAMSNYVLGCAATACAAAREPTRRPDPESAPLYARLHAQGTDTPEEVVVSGLYALSHQPR